VTFAGSNGVIVIRSLWLVTLAILPIATLLPWRLPRGL
jgi:hypothetical protein